MEGCIEAMHTEEVLEDMKVADVADAKCITQHSGFNCFCLQKWSLKMSADGYKTKSNARYRQLGKRTVVAIQLLVRLLPNINVIVKSNIMFFIGSKYVVV